MEDGEVEGAWWRYEALLWDRFVEHVQGYVATGGELDELWLNPWTLKEILEAAREAVP